MGADIQPVAMEKMACDDLIRRRVQMAAAYEPQDSPVQPVWDENLYVAVRFDCVTNDTRTHTAPLGWAA